MAQRVDEDRVMLRKLRLEYADLEHKSEALLERIADLQAERARTLQALRDVQDRLAALRAEMA